MTKKKITRNFKRFLALGLSVSMIFADLLPAAASVTEGSAGTEILESGITQEQLKEALAQDSELYPDGGIEFFISQISAEEGEKQQLILVRRGGTEQETTVDFKSIDISATYGEDYLLTAKESDFVAKTLEGTGKPLSDFHSEEMELVEEEAAAEDENSEDEIPEEVEVKEESEVKTETKAKEDTRQTARNSKANGKKASGSVLQTAKNTYLGTESSHLNWQELDEAQKEEAKARSEAYEQAYNEFAGGVEGTAYTFTFKPGEYMKTIDIDTLDDDISESDEQAMFLLSNVSTGELAGTVTAYLNITDNDENEKAIFAMDASEITVDRSEEKAEIVINRVSGNNKIASVIVGTGSDTAQSGTDYEAVQKEVVFAQGVTSQAVEIPLLNYEGAPETAQFQVALDAESSFVQEGRAITTVTLTDNAPETEEAAIAENTDDTDSDGELNADAAAAWSDTRNVNTSASVRNANSTWSGRKLVLSGLDLSTADRITVTWRSDEGSYTYRYTEGSGCNKETTTKTAKDRKTYLYINGAAALQRGDAFKSRSDDYVLPEGAKTENADIKLEVRTIGENRNATARVSKVVIHYPGYQYTITNTEFTDGPYSNVYTEKIYTDDEGANKTDEAGHRYKEGNKIKLGDAQIACNGRGNYADSVTIHRSGDSLQIKNTYSANKTSNNVQIKESDNIYLAGYQLQKAGGKGWSSLIAPGDLRLSKEFIATYRDCLHTGNEFRIRPVYRPFEARVMFQNANPLNGSYANGFETNEVLRCTTLDTIKVRAIANKGYSVKSFNLGTYRDSKVHQQGISAKQLAARANDYYGHSKSTIVSETKKVSGSSYPKVNVTTAVVNPALGNVVTFTPTGEFTYINPVYSVPSILVKIDPYNNSKDKGEVVYTRPESEGGGVLGGNYKTPLEITGITPNKEYTINAVTEDNFKAYFKNFTGDSNEDGKITTSEEKAVAAYEFVRTASNGNAYTFRPVLDKSLIFYGFVPIVPNRYEGFIDGVVELEEKPIFGTKTTVKAINGAQVSAGGLNTVSRTDDQFGGVDESGGDGYFSISSRDFVAGENQTVNITYNNLHLTATQAVNAAGIYKLDSYDTIGVSQADVFQVEGSRETKISANNIANGDKTYRIAIQTYSKNKTVSAVKAVYKFYRKDGSLIDGAAKEVKSTNGTFVLDFNPKTLKIPAGTTMSVQFFDQRDVGYYEHDMGFSFAESLGILSFISSFNFGGAEKALEVIGTIDSAFQFGWDGNIDDVSTGSEDGNKKTISIGYSFSTDKDLTEEDEKKKGNLKEAARNSGTTSDQKKKQQKAADDAIDKNGQGNKQTAKLAASASVELSFGLEINICRSQAEGHMGEWYFQDMTLAATAAGGVDATITYVTPIGIPVRVGIATGASGAATFTIDQNYDKEEHYLSQIMDKDAPKIDIFDFNMKNTDRAFDAYGIFCIAPYLDLSAGAGYDFLNLMVGGRADFNMNFYTRSDQTNTGDVKFSAYISLKVLFFTKKWNIANTTVNMFGGASSLEELSGGADYSYESLSTMEVDDRAYLKNRSEWQGENTKAERSVASTSGITEKVLQQGVNPNPDIKMTALPGGGYLAVFLDDDGSGDDYNSIHVYYTLSDDGKSWTRPEMIEKDGTTDDAPALFDLGEKGIYVAWSSADRLLNEKDTVISSLNSMNIHGAFFDTSTKKFGEIQEITKTAPFTYTDEDGTEISDNVADIEPQISYDAYTQRMIMYYTKIEYESTAADGDDEGLVGDVAKPFSLIAYREYNFKEGKWVDTYRQSEHMDENYEKAWYGQRFLDVAPVIVVKETVDEYGYWTEDPVIEKYQKATYTGTDGKIYEQEPVVIESVATSYSGLGLYAYVLDYDGDKGTETDRDIFLQVYNYSDNTFTHPIMVTTTMDKAESSINFGRSGDTTLLTYVADNTLYALNLSYIVANGLVYIPQQKLYYLNKKAPTGEESDYDWVYMPPVAVAGEKLADAAGGSSETESTGEGETEKNHSTIVDYQIASTNDYVYAFWTQQDTKAREGIDANSEEAQKPENRVTESQIYVARYDAADTFITSPVQVTDEEGANYGSLGCVVTDGKAGQVKLLATKAESTLDTVTGTDDSGKEISQDVVVQDTDHTSLVALDFTPVSTLTVKNVAIAELTAGTESTVTMEFYNDGVETLKGLTLSVMDKAGAELYTETIQESIYGGRTHYADFPVTLDADATGCAFTYEITDSEGKKLAEGSYSEEIPMELDVTNFEAVTTERGAITFRAEVTNNSRRKSGKQKINISKMMEEAEEKFSSITSFTTDDLLPGQSGIYTVTYDYGSYDDMFTTFISRETEEYKAVTHFKASAQAGGKAGQAEITMKASKEQRLRMNAIQKLSVLDGSYQPVGNTYQMAKGDITQLNMTVESIAYSGSRYAGTDDKENYDRTNTGGLKVMYRTDNEDVLTVYDSGYVEAVGDGTATVTAYVMPANNKFIYTEETGSLVEDNFPLLPEEAMEKMTFQVTVGKKVPKPDDPKPAPVNLSKCTVTLSKTSYIWDGKEKKPSVKVTDPTGRVLVLGTDYTAAFPSSAKNAGTYQVTVTGKGNYTGTVTRTFKIQVAKGRTYKIGKYRYKVTSNVSGRKPGSATLVKTPNLKKIVVPNSVKIGGQSYRVTAVGKGAFKGARKLTQVSIGKYVTTIGSKAFYGCKKLTRVVLGKSLKTIGTKAFYKCGKLKSIVIRSAKLKRVGSKAIYRISKKAVIRVPASKVKAYKKKFTRKTGYRSSMKIKK